MGPQLGQKGIWSLFQNLAVEPFGYLVSVTATRTSLDSCNSVESIEPPIVEKAEKKQTKQMTPLSNTRKLPRETSTKSKKQGNVSSNTAKTTKTGIIESSVTITT